MVLCKVYGNFLSWELGPLSTKKFSWINLRIALDQFQNSMRSEPLIMQSRRALYVRDNPSRETKIARNSAKNLTKSHRLPPSPPYGPQQQSSFGFVVLLPLELYPRDVVAGVCPVSVQPPAAHRSCSPRCHTSSVRERGARVDGELKARAHLEHSPLYHVYIS